MSSSRLLPVVPALLAGLLSTRAQAISFVEGGWISPEVRMVSSIKTTDFNDDGRTDLVVMENQGTKVICLENMGGGRFRQAGLWDSTSNGGICHGIEDFDGDGNLDLLVRISDHSPAGGYLVIYYGTGLGKFEPQRSGLVLAGDAGSFSSVKDVDGDGRPDILSDHVWLNQGDGTFVAVNGSEAIASLPGKIAGPNAPVAWGDGEAAPDLFVPSSGGAVTRYPNLGNGTFGAGVTVIAGNPRVNLTGLAVAVLPAISEQPCLVRTVQSGARQMIELYLQNGETFALAATAPAGAFSPGGVQALRDGDHTRILLTIAKSTTAYSPTELLVTRKGAKITLKLAAIEKPSRVYDKMALADMNGDGTLDLVLAENGIGWHAGVAGATFSGIRNEASGVDNGNTVCYTGDLDNDGAVDLVTQSSANAFLPQRITLWKNSGHGESFQPTTLPVTGDWVSFVAAGDWDQDGWPDLLVRTTKLGGRLNVHSTNRLLLISRFPNGRFAQKTLITNSGPAWTDASLQNGDADGVLDFVTNVYAPGDTANHYQIFPGKTATSFATKLALEGPLPLMKIYTDTDWSGTLRAVSRPDSSRYTGPISTSGGSTSITYFPPPLIPGLGTAFGDLWPVNLDFDNDGHTDFISKSNGYDLVIPARRTAGHVTYSANPVDYGTYTRFPNHVICYARMQEGGAYDAIYQTEYDIRFRENLGGLKFGPEVVLSGLFKTGDGAIMTADLDGDGVQDIIASSANDSSRLRWFKGVKN